MASEKKKDSEGIPSQPESSAQKLDSCPQCGPEKPSQAEGDEETVEKALRNQEHKSK